MLLVVDRPEGAQAHDGITGEPRGCEQSEVRARVAVVGPFRALILAGARQLGEKGPAGT